MIGLEGISTLVEHSQNQKAPLRDATAPQRELQKHVVRCATIRNSTEFYTIPESHEIHEIPPESHEIHEIPRNPTVAAQPGLHTGKPDGLLAPPRIKKRPNGAPAFHAPKGRLILTGGERVTRNPRWKSSDLFYIFFEQIRGAEATAEGAYIVRDARDRRRQRRRQRRCRRK